MSGLADQLFSLSSCVTRIRVHVAGNIYEKLEDPLKPWIDTFLPQPVQSTLELEVRHTATT
jgi:hypothetical protein